MKKIYALLLTVTAFTLGQAQGTITQWNFEGSTTPSTGTGTLTLIGGTTASSTAFPTGQSGLSYSITTFPGDTSNSGTAGYQFNTSTTGYNGITVSFYVSGLTQSSRWQQYEYSINGGTWMSLGNNNGGLTQTYAQKSFNLPATCDNISNLAFRVVSIFRQPENDRYQSIQNGNGYNGNNGSWQIDGVTFSYATLGTSKNDVAGLRMYPNPAKDNLFITSDSYAAKSVEIFDVLGKTVLSAKVNNNAINIASLSKGVYVAKITEEGKTATRKLVIE